MGALWVDCNWVRSQHSTSEAEEEGTRPNGYYKESMLLFTAVKQPNLGDVEHQRCSCKTQHTRHKLLAITMALLGDKGLYAHIVTQAACHRTSRHS